MALFGKTRKETTELRVGGMTCGNCVSRIKDALESVVGVTRADVDLDAGTAQVTARPGTRREDLVVAVREAGYAAE